MACRYSFGVALVSVTISNVHTVSCYSDQAMWSVGSLSHITFSVKLPQSQTHMHKRVHVHILQFHSHWFVLWVESQPARGGWRSTTMTLGGLSARLTGVYRMPQWCAESWGTLAPWQLLDTPHLEQELDGYVHV